MLSTTLTGDTTIPVALPRILSPSIDCAVVACEVVVQLYTGDFEQFYDFGLPVAFDPHAPVAASPTAAVLPSAGLWDRQRVEVRGNDFDPGAFANARQCAVLESDTVCADPVESRADNLGRLRESFVVRRTLTVDGVPVTIPAETLLVDPFLQSAFEETYACSPDLDGDLVPVE